MNFDSKAARGWPRLARMSLVTLFAGASLSLLTLEAGAVSKRVKEDCTGDYLRFCPQYDEGTPQVRHCMSYAGRRGQLSPRCLRSLVDAGLMPRKYWKR